MANPLSWLFGLGSNKQGRGMLGNFLFGTPEEHERISTLLPEQQQLLMQILNDDPALMEQFFAPEKRRFNQEIIPGLAEQFAGMGSGNLSSSGFRNAAINAGVDLNERLAAIRAGLKQQALGNFSQDVVTQPGTQGFLSGAAPALAQAGIGYLTGGPVGGLGGLFGGMSQKGKTGPYGGGLSRSGNPGY